MTEEDIQSVMVFVDEYCRSRVRVIEVSDHPGWTNRQIEAIQADASQARRNLIARLKEIP